MGLPVYTFLLRALRLLYFPVFCTAPLWDMWCPASPRLPALIFRQLESLYVSVTPHQDSVGEDELSWREGKHPHAFAEDSSSQRKAKPNALSVRRGKKDTCEAFLSLGRRPPAVPAGSVVQESGAGRGGSLALWVFIQLREKCQQAINLPP